MRTLRFCVFALLFSGVSVGQAAPSTAPQIVEIPSGNVRLKAFLWKPEGSGPFPAVLFNHGSGGADAAHTAGRAITEAAEQPAPPFTKRGYAFLFLFRRGQGLSAEQAPFIQDVLQREETAQGKEARRHLQFVLLTTAQLNDVMAALSFLKTAPGIAPPAYCGGWAFVRWATHAAGSGTRPKRTRRYQLRGRRQFLARLARTAPRAAYGRPPDNLPHYADSGGQRLQHSSRPSSGRGARTPAQAASLEDLPACWPDSGRWPQRGVSGYAPMGRRRFQIPRRARPTLIAQ